VSPRLDLGWMLLAADRPGDAEAVFRDDLDVYAENGWALYGLAESLRAQGRRRRGRPRRGALRGGLGAMDAWGMASAPERRTRHPPSGRADGKRVIILGAGLAGMTAAYELSKLGYETPILEAREFAGGRVQTARRGFTSPKSPARRNAAMFDEGQYINHGPWRIPYHHRSTLHYTKEFGVPLHIMVNDNDNAWDYRERRATRGRVSAAGAASSGPTSAATPASCSRRPSTRAQLDDELTEEDRERLVNYLVALRRPEPRELEYRGTPAAATTRTRAPA
jgi:monoamine oxidase